MTTPYDVIVIGGGAAGLSGAVLLARSRRAVLVIDAGEPRNAPAVGVHNFLSRDGITPRALLELGRAELREYGGELIDGCASDIERTSDGFAVSVADGRTYAARRVLVTTGLVDELPDIPGVRERWGHDVLHPVLPRLGGAVRDQAIGVLATTAHAVHMAQLFRQLTSDVVLFAHTGPDLDAQQRESSRHATSASWLVKWLGSRS